MVDVAGLITANYNTERLGRLTSERTIASLPYGSRYRLIDFPLSNMVNTGIKTVGVITPYKYRSILDHIGTGKEWSLDRKNEGLFVLPGSVFGISNSESRFLLRDMDRNKPFLLRSAAPYVIASSSNTIYNMDYTDLYRAHRESGADMTMVYRKADRNDPYVTKIHTEGELVTGVRQGVKPGDKAFMDCFIISRNLLLKMLEWYAAIKYLDLFEAIAEDYDKMDVRLYEFRGYSATIYDTETYFRHSLDLLNTAVRDELFSEDRPVMTKVQDTVPTKYLKDADVKNSLIPAGCIIGGTVERSILFRGVRVESGAVVKNSVIMQSCVIGRSAHVENAIIDKNNIISAGIVIKGSADSIFIQEKSMTKEKNFAGATP